MTAMLSMVLMMTLPILPAVASDGIGEKRVTSEENAMNTSEEHDANRVPENELTIESWMIDPEDPFWTEKENNLESWMYDIQDPFWSQLTGNEEYDIESWMVDPSSWIPECKLIATTSK